MSRKGHHADHDTSRAKKAAANGPVFITDRGWAAHVLLSIEAYQMLTRQSLSIGDILAMTGCPRLHIPDPRPDRDALVAAAALVHGMAAVTRDVADFGPTDVQIINPWAP